MNKEKSTKEEKISTILKWAIIPYAVMTLSYLYLTTNFVKVMNDNKKNFIKNARMLLHLYKNLIRTVIIFIQ